MMLVYWLLLGVFGSAMLLLWIWLMPRKRVYFSAGMSAVAFALMAISGPSVERLTQTGDVVDAPVPVTIQLLLGLLALLSLTTLILYRLDEYPPPQDQEIST